MPARRVWARICVGNADKTPDQLADAASSIQIHPSESTKAHVHGVLMSPLDGPAAWIKCLSNSSTASLSFCCRLELTCSDVAGRKERAQTPGIDPRSA